MFPRPGPASANLAPQADLNTGATTSYKLSGDDEVQTFEGEEADLKTFNTRCTKNPDHKSFIPVDGVTMEKLSEEFRDEDMFRLILCTANLTLRVGVTQKSPDRPRIGQGDSRVGSAAIWGIEFYEGGVCECETCRTLPTPKQVHGRIWMYTAKHVVFDDFEAKTTFCRLCFYRNRKGRPLYTLTGWKVERVSDEEDKCEMYCESCDVRLMKYLQTMIDSWEHYWLRVNKKLECDENKKMFMVSHPHGCPMQISVGNWIDKTTVTAPSGTRYTYTTPTCPGCSGAHVHILGSHGEYFTDLHVHSGVNEGINHSSVGFY